MEPGRLVGIFRNGHPKADGTFWKSESRNGGRTWAVPKRTNVQSKRHSSPAQIVLHGGYPTLVYADRRMASLSAVKTSDPELLVWHLAGRLPCCLYNTDDSPIRDGRCPASVQVDAHTRLIVDYQIRPSQKRIAGYFVPFFQDWGKRA